MTTNNIPALLTDSPLAEATPDSLHEIFIADPMTKTPQEWERLVGALRDWRAKALKAEVEGKVLRQKRVAKPKASTTTLDVDSIDFEL
jgi:hypothetical protein